MTTDLFQSSLLQLPLQQFSLQQEQQLIQHYLTTLTNKSSAMLHTIPEVLVCKPSTISTNDDAIQLCQQGVQSAMVISRQQQSGRGQHQHQWFSVDGNIFVSILLPLQRALTGQFALECGLGLIHCQSLTPLYQHNLLQLKWANDLYSPYGKWGGILIEPVPHRQPFVVIGIGINIVALPQQLQQHIQQPITSLTDLSHQANLSQYWHVARRCYFLAEIYTAIYQATQWFNFASQNLAQRFNSVMAFRHQNVQVQRQDGRIIRGILHGIQNDGALVIQQKHLSNWTICYDGRLTPITD